MPSELQGFRTYNRLHWTLLALLPSSSFRQYFLAGAGGAEPLVILHTPRIPSRDKGVINRSCVIYAKENIRSAYDHHPDQIVGNISPL